MTDLTVMIIDVGGRAHTLSSIYEQSKRVNSIIVVPGNDMISYRRKKEVLCIREVEEKDASEILVLAKKYKVDLVDVVSPMALSLGVVDELRKAGFKVFGPKKDAARIDTNKVWARNFMKKYRIPSPRYDVFSDEKLALEYVKAIYRYDANRALYIKASGICDGKGVIKAENFEQAVTAIHKMSSFGEAADSFLIEEGLDGEEVTVTVITDGKHYHLLKTSHNEKYLRNFDRGPITRGVGANSPALSLDRNSEMSSDIERQIIRKAILGLANEGCPFTGVLTAVIMLVQEGGRLVPKVIEFNGRWSSPNSQVIIPGIKTDYVDIAEACINGELKDLPIQEDDKARICLVGCARGYPGDTSNVNGKIIFGLKSVLREKGIDFYGSAVELSNENFYAMGGRLFHIVASGKDIVEAKSKAYAAISLVTVEGNNLFYRTDVAWRDVEIAQMQKM